ncbi:hypothetical protein [Bacillus cereus]
MYEYIKKEKCKAFQEYKKNNPIKDFDPEKSNNLKYYLEPFEYLQKTTECRVYADLNTLSDEEIERFIEHFIFDFSPAKSSKIFSIITI